MHDLVFQCSSKRGQPTTHLHATCIIVWECKTLAQERDRGYLVLDLLQHFPSLRECWNRLATTRLCHWNSPQILRNLIGARTLLHSWCAHRHAMTARTVQCHQNMAGWKIPEWYGWGVTAGKSFSHVADFATFSDPCPQYCFGFEHSNIGFPVASISVWSLDVWGMFWIGHAALGVPNGKDSWKFLSQCNRKAPWHVYLYWQSLTRQESGTFLRISTPSLKMPHKRWQIWDITLNDCESAETHL